MNREQALRQWREMIQTEQKLRAREDFDAKRTLNQSLLAKRVARALIHYRINNRLTQQSLGRCLHMGTSAITRLEIGEHSPHINTLQILAESLQLTFITIVEKNGTSVYVIDNEEKESEEELEKQLYEVRLRKFKEICEKLNY